MKILLLNQFFWPDSSATSQLLTDLARSLADEGHDVTVICSDKGGYAEPADALNAPPVMVSRVSALPFVRGTLGRFLSYLSFYVSAAMRGLLLAKQDLVVTLTTPPLLSLLGTLIKFVHGSQHFIWEMDVYPDVAVDLEYFRKNGFLDRITGTFADLSRMQADGVIALGECMKERLQGRGISAEKIFIAENWADGTAIEPLPRVGSPEKLVVLYSGNLGLAHDLKTVAASISSLRADPRFHFLFVGSGGRRAELAAFVEKQSISSVELRPYVQRESLSQGLALGDIGLVTQREACCGSVVPSKVYGLLAAGRPILFIGPSTATPARIIARFGCGWHVAVGDDVALTSLLQHLASHPEEVHRAGVLARKTLLDHFDVRHGVARILTILNAHRSAPKSVEFALASHGSRDSASLT